MPRTIEVAAKGIKVAIRCDNNGNYVTTVSYKAAVNGKVRKNAAYRSQTATMAGIGQVSDFICSFGVRWEEYEVTYGNGLGMYEAQMIAHFFPLWVADSFRD